MRALLILIALAQPLSAGGLESTLITATRTQVGVTTTYDPAYQTLQFPGGDIDRTRGVCTDVIIRAFRDGWG